MTIAVAAQPAGKLPLDYEVSDKDAPATDTPGNPLDSEEAIKELRQVEDWFCESTDALGTHDLPPLRRDDLIVIGDAGAYAASQGSA